MKFPLWFRYLWWATLTILVIIALLVRRGSVFGTQPTAVDLLFLALLAALATVPIFVEFKFGGVEWKQHVDQVKRDLQTEIGGLRAELKATMEVSNRLTQQVVFADVSPSDERLKREEGHIRAIVDGALQRRGVAPQQVDAVGELIDHPEQRLILGRAALEREVRRVWKERVVPFGERYAPRGYSLNAMVSELTSEGVVDTDLAHVIRELYSVGSDAVHGNGFTPTQAAFADEVLPGVLATLRSM